MHLINRNIHFTAENTTTAGSSRSNISRLLYKKKQDQKFVTDFKDALVEAENICFKEFEITKTKPEHHQLHFYQLLMSQSHDKESIICLSKNYFLQRRIPLQQAVVEVI